LASSNDGGPGKLASLYSVSGVCTLPHWMGTARFLEGLPLDRSEVATSPMAHDKARKINFKMEPTPAAVGADKKCHGSRSRPAGREDIHFRWPWQSIEGSWELAQIPLSRFPCIMQLRVVSCQREGEVDLKHLR
jgi:hypothetical protein